MGQAEQAGHPAQPGPEEMAQGKVGYCVIGLGRIADHFMRGVRESSTSQITGLVSGHRDKAERLAAEYGVPTSSIYSYEDMDRMRENKAIQAVYVALPNSMHCEYTVRSAKAGKNVLCEKPMATSVKEAKEMIAACRENHVLLMIAYRLHYEPTTKRAIKLIRDGALGQVQSIVSANGFNESKGEWRLDKKLAGGGPLMDVGIYCLNATRYLTGEEPVKFTAVVSTIDKDGRFDSVEENTSWTTLFPSGIEATCTTTYGGQMPGFYKVYGSKGWMEVDNFGYEGLRLKAEFRDGKNAVVQLDELNTEKDPTQFVRQVDHFSECIRTGRQPDTVGDEGLKDMESMKAIYKAAGVKAL
ncbi:MAG: Gfo/Idh/MocA family oxidoreductase [Acidobacteria bacterium]|nr:Gfo/Idh/MocA family oxidoreductase [Acidobacteriota bacterium]